MKDFLVDSIENEEGKIERVSVGEVAKNCNLKVVSGSDEQIMTFSSVSINRPGLFLTGFEEYFAGSRIQVMGNAEIYYLIGLPKDKRLERLDKLFMRGIPCLILSRGLKPMPEMLETAKKYNVPIFLSSKITSEIVNNMVAYLNRLLAPSISLHGVFINVKGIGILLIGDSGIGKSEMALELLHRGHRLISDDAVLVKRVGYDLIGQSPAVTKGFMEIRGVGIIDVIRVYGIGALQTAKNIELVIELEKWQKDKQYDRIGRDIQYTEFLGIKVPKIIIPVTEGRNLTTVIEMAASNFRLRESGYIAADDIEGRLKKN